MSTSIITTTTFTFATIIDVQAQPILAPVPAVTAEDEIEITPCMLNALRRCELTARKHCVRRDVHKS